MQSRLKFACPRCEVRLMTQNNQVGKSFDCPRCKGQLTVPSPDSLPVPCRALVPVSRTDTPLRVIKRRKKRPAPSGTTPLSLQFPKGMGGVKARVSQGTANTVAKTMAGGLLVAIGVFLMSMLGGKPKS